MENKRSVYKIVNNNEIPISFKDIKEGMRVSLYEPDGKRVKDDNGNTVFTTISDAFLNADDVLTFETKE